MICNDCSVDVLEIGDWYMCAPKVWEAELGLGWKDNLCLACLEKRLARPIKASEDVLPIASGIETSGERFEGSLTAIGPKRISDRLVQIFGFNRMGSARG
jgi:hypothetical protein